MIDPRHLCQIELYVRDSQQALEFYAAVFAWKAVPAEIHGVFVLDVPEDCPFGICLVAKGPSDHPSASASCLYFAHPHPERLMDLVEKYGGKLISANEHLPSYGHLFVFESPDGQRFGLFKRQDIDP